LLVTEQPDRVLPDVTSDEQDTGWGELPAGEDDDVRRFVDERPPHHEDRD
jgi:hypothetical protein